jgi:alpha-methylacyl-CoA racemase
MRQSWTESCYDGIVVRDDGEWPVVRKPWSQFTRWRRAGLSDRELDIQNDPKQWPDMHARYAEVFRRRTSAEWMALFEDSDACAAPVLTFSEAAEHPHNVARGTFINPGGVLQAAPAPRFGRTPAARPRPPTAVGQDTYAVLRECGVTDEEFLAWKIAGAFP